MPSPIGPRKRKGAGSHGAGPRAILLLFFFVLAACSALPGAVPTPTSTSSLPPGPTATPSPAASPTPTGPPTATPLPEPTPTPTPASIGRETLPDLALVAEAGAGSLGEIALSPDGRTIAAAGSQGTWLLDKFSLETRFRLGPELGAALSVAWSPDGSRLATGWADGSVRLWEWAGGSHEPVQAAVLVGHTGPVRTVAWSPDGSRLASGGEDQAIRAWDAGSFKNTFSFFHTSAIHSVDWHPGSELLLIGEFDGSISVVNAADGSTAASFFAHEGWVDVVRWSPDGTRVVSGGLDRQLVFWEAATRFDGTIGFEQDLVIPTLFSIASAFWTPDGTMVAAAGGIPYSIQYFGAAPAANDEEIRTPALTLEGHAGPIEGLAPSPGGVLLTSSQDNTLRVWDLETAAELRRLSALTGPAFTGGQAGAAWSPAGDRFATAGSDGVLRVWDAASGELAWQTAAHVGGATGVTWSANGAWIATGGTDNFTRVWEAATGELAQELRSEGGRVNAVSFAPFGNQLASGGFFRIAQVWDAGTDQSPILLYPDVEITALGWSSSATLLAIGGSDGSVHLYNIPAVAEIGVFDEEYSTPIAAIAWEPGGGLVAAMDRRGTIAIWNNISGELVARHDGSGGVWGGLAWSPRGVLAAGSDDGTVLFLDAATLEPLALKAAHGAGIADVQFSPDGRSLATVDAGGGIRFWALGVEAAAPLALTLPETGAPGAMPAFTWPPSGPITPTNAADIEQLAVIGRGTASVYDATEDYIAVGGSTGVWIYTRDDREPVRYLEGGRTFGVDLTSDGRYLVARELQLIRVWDVERALLLRAIPAGVGAQDAVAYSPDGTLFAAGERGGRVTVVSFLSGAAVYGWETGAEVTDLDWSPDGRQLAAASGADIWLWDVPLGEQVALLVGHEDVVRAIDFHPSEALLLSGGDDDAVLIWELDTIVSPEEAEEGEEVVWPAVASDSLTSNALANVLDVLWIEGGDRFVTAQTFLILYWGTATREIQDSFEYIEGQWRGKLAEDEQLNTLLIDGSKGHLPAVAETGWVERFAGDLGSLIVRWEDLVLAIKNLEQFDGLDYWNEWDFEYSVLRLIPAGDQPRYIGSSTGQPSLWNLDPNYSWTSHAIPEASFPPQFGLEQDWIAAASTEGFYVAWVNNSLDPMTLEILDLRTDTTETIFPIASLFDGKESFVLSLAWAPDSEFVFAGLNNGLMTSINVENTSIGFEVQVYADQVTSVQLSPDGQLIAVGGSDGNENGGQQFTRLVDPRSGRTIREFPLDFGRTAQVVAFSPDGSLLVSGDSSGGLLVWDVVTGERLADLRGHTLAVTGVAFSPDGMAFATSSRDGTVRIWGIP